MEKISIIVPVYNVAAYLEKCVHSIMNQRYSNLEIILVDDGSTDGSAQLCNQLAQEDERVVVIHKQNGGLSDARNAGVKKATGALIGFVDSDDWIHEEMYVHLYELIQKTEADVSECCFTFVSDERQRVQSEESFELTLDRKEYLREYLTMERLYGATCCRLIRSEIAKKIQFPVGKIYEDIYYAIELIQTATRFVISDKPYYYYLTRTNSITNERFNDRQLTLIEVVGQLNQYAVQEFPDLKLEAENREMYAYFSILNQVILLENYTNNPTYQRILKYFKDHFREILQNPVISRNRKLAVFILMISPFLYKKVLLRYMKGM